MRIYEASVMFVYFKLRELKMKLKKNSLTKSADPTNASEWVKETKVKKLTRLPHFWVESDQSHGNTLWVCEHFITLILLNRLIFVLKSDEKIRNKRTEKPIKLTIENNSNEFFVCVARARARVRVNERAFDIPMLVCSLWFLYFD